MTLKTSPQEKTIAALRSADPWTKQDAIQRAEVLCARRRARLTPLRRWVLERLWVERNQPKGAYELLDELNQEMGSVAPPTIYRALNFLLEQGLIHKLERLNAFIACNRPEQPHVTRFMLCKDCGIAEEIYEDLLDEAVLQAAERTHFEIVEGTIEIVGNCLHHRQGKCDRRR